MYFLTLLCALRLAPLSQSRATTSKWPSSAAAITGVSPTYQKSQSATLQNIIYARYDPMSTVLLSDRSISAYLVPGLDVRPPVQEDLGSLQVASHSSTVESGRPILSKTRRQNWMHSLLLPITSPTYIGAGLDVGSLLAEQVGDLGVTV